MACARDWHEQHTHDSSCVEQQQDLSILLKGSRLLRWMQGSSPSSSSLSADAGDAVTRQDRQQLLQKQHACDAHGTASRAAVDGANESRQAASAATIPCLWACGSGSSGLASVSSAMDATQHHSSSQAQDQDGAQQQTQQRDAAQARCKVKRHARHPPLPPWGKQHAQLLEFKQMVRGLHNTDISLSLCASCCLFIPKPLEDKQRAYEDLATVNLLTRVLMRAANTRDHAAGGLTEIDLSDDLARAVADEALSSLQPGATAAGEAEAPRLEHRAGRRALQQLAARCNGAWLVGQFQELAARRTKKELDYPFIVMRDTVLILRVEKMRACVCCWALSVQPESLG